jgi:hypothetical protein
MRLRANHRPYQTLCTAIARLMTLSIDQAAISQASQQDATPASQENCPTISVSCAYDFGHEESKIFTASIDGILAETIRYDWAVSSGTILEGQGTATIKVDVSAVGRQAITATVTVHGLPTSCATKASCSFGPSTPPPPTVLFDTYYPKSIGAAVPKKTRRRRRSPRLH